MKKIIIFIITILLFLFCSFAVYAQDEEKSAFIVDDSMTYTVAINDERYSLYAKKMFADANGDGLFNAADARAIIRISAQIDPSPEDLTMIDIDANGSVTAMDARLALRASASIDTYYYSPDGEIPIGFALFADDKSVYFAENGRISKGYCQIDGDYYLFDNDGQMQTGFSSYEGKTAYFDENGKGVTGKFSDDNGKTYYFERGLAVSGFKTIDNTTYWFSSNGVVPTEQIVALDGGYYYLNKDASIYKGWLKSGLNYYFFADNGVMKANALDDDYSFNANGVASARRLNQNTFDVYICDILKREGSTPRDIFNYVYNNFRYKYYGKSDPKSMAIRILNNGRGACYDYANLTKYLLEAAGYECQIIVGDSFNPNNGSEHDWVIVKVDGVWRHIDTQRGYYLKTDSQMRSAGYGWNKNNYPAAV